jgi:LDH2 family malate/lactate/ureidoglycolate dehydrogenase
MEPAPAPEGPFHLLPVGATRELGSHKGYGFSVMVQMFSSILSGAGFSLGGRGPGAFNHYFAAYSVQAFLPVEEFKESMDEFLRALRETPPVPGQQRVYYAGLPEAEELAERRAHGIPYHKEVVGWFHHICHELSLPVLF